MKKGLSKSRIIAGRQCPKRLYLETYHPELKDDSNLEAVFAIGNAFGALARGLYPGGLLIEQDDDLSGAIDTTSIRFLKRRSHTTAYWCEPIS